MQAIRKLYGLLRGAREAAVGRTLPQAQEIQMQPHAVDVDQDLDEAAQVRPLEGLCSGLKNEQAL